MISWRTPLAVTAAALMLSPGVTHHAHAVSCAAPLAKFGPVNPVHGFPDYYQDSMGLALKPCARVRQIAAAGRAHGLGKE